MKALSLRNIAALAATCLVALGAGCGPKSSAPADAGPEGGTGPKCATIEDDLISDFKTSNGIQPADGRQGGWYTYGDPFGTVFPAPGGGFVPDLDVGNLTCSGPGSLHFRGTGFVEWGAATGTNFMPMVPTDAGGLAKGTYDATKSNYKGVAFWARAAAPVRFVMVKFLDPYTDRESILPNSEWCTYTPMMPKNCSPYIVKFGYGYTGDDDAANLADYPAYHDYGIDTNWKRFEILFEHTKQDRFNPGQKSPGDKLAVNQLMGMAIQVNADRSTMPGTILPNDFDMWIDDITFIK